MNKRRANLEELVIEKKDRKEDMYRILRELYAKVQEGKIKLYDPAPPKSFYEYLIRSDYAAWLWTIYVLILLTLVSIFLVNKLLGISPLSYIFATIYVFFLPGYVTIEALYPYEKTLTPLERLTLSIGLSLAIVPLIGLILNFTPWGIRLEPIVCTLCIYIIVISMTAAHRKFRLISKASNNAVPLIRIISQYD